MIYRDFEISNHEWSVGKSDRYLFVHKDYDGPEDRNRIGTAYDPYEAQQSIDDWHYDRDPCVSNIKWITVEGETLEVNDSNVEGETIYFMTMKNKYATSIQGYNEPSGQFNHIDFEGIERV